MVIQFLCARYPGQFQLVREGKDKVFVNGILGTRHDLTREEPLHVLRDNVPEDFGLMLRGDDGKYVFRAGVICTAQGWNLGQKIGQPLAAIHGPVPDYQTKMELSMDRSVILMYLHYQVLKSHTDKRNVGSSLGWPPAVRFSAPPGVSRSASRCMPPLAIPATRAGRFRNPPSLRLTSIYGLTGRPSAGSRCRARSSLTSRCCSFHSPRSETSHTYPSCCSRC